MSVQCSVMGVPTRALQRAIVVLLGWRHWKSNICHLSFLLLVVMERYTKEQRVIYFLNKQCVLLQD